MGSPPPPQRLSSTRPGPAAGSAVVSVAVVAACIQWCLVSGARGVWCQMVTVHMRLDCLLTRAAIFDTNR